MKTALKHSVHKKIRNERFSESVQCYAMISTMLIGFVVLTVYPILWTFRWSWYSYNGVPSLTKFIGWDNFITMFTTDLTYWKAWLNTLVQGLTKVAIEIPFAMFVALLLNSRIKLSGLFRSIFYLPHIISVAIIGVIFTNIFSYWGLLNTFLKNIGLLSAEIDWFATKSKALTMILSASIWSGFGVNVMYFLAALANVPEELYESAKLDGASVVRTFFSVTLPSIVPVFKIVVLMALVAALSSNELILVTTNGAPAGNTLTVMAYLTKQFVPGFAETATPKLGYGCAMSLVTTIIFALVAIVYNMLSSRMKSE